MLTFGMFGSFATFRLFETFWTKRRTEDQELRRIFVNGKSPYLSWSSDLLFHLANDRTIRTFRTL
jgi:hypothetical protein